MVLGWSQCSLGVFLGGLRGVLKLSHRVKETLKQNCSRFLFFYPLLHKSTQGGHSVVTGWSQLVTGWSQLVTGWLQLVTEWSWDGHGVVTG